MQHLQSSSPKWAKNLSTLLAAIKACSASRDLAKGKALHAQAVLTGDDYNTYVANSLLNMYAKCGCMTEARKLFDQMPHRGVVSWTVLMLGYTDNGEAILALELFHQMRLIAQSSSSETNPRPFVAALKACSSLAAQESGKLIDGKLLKVSSLDQGREIHAQVAAAGFDSDVFVASALINMYIKCGSMEDSCKIFRGMNSKIRDAVTWTSLIRGYVEIREEEIALDLFSQMLDEGVAPDALAFVAALNACSALAIKEPIRQVDGKFLRLKSLEKGREVHLQTELSGFDTDLKVMNSLLDMYAKCGSTVDFRRIFDRMSTHSVASWTALMQGYVENGEAELALRSFVRMQSDACEPDALAFVAVLKACSSVAEKEDASEIQDTGNDLVRFKARSLETGMAIHSQAMRSRCDSDIFVASRLVDMYSKCGSLADARKVFDAIPRRDVVLWTAMIVGYAENGKEELALELFSCMKAECGLTPDAPCLIAALNACTSLAATEQGRIIDGRMVKPRSLATGMSLHAELANRLTESDFFVVASRLVDMYAKCGSLIDSRAVFDRMFCHSIVTWTSLLLGYAENSEPEIVLELFAELISVIRPDAQTFVAVLKSCERLVMLKLIHGEICRLGVECDEILANSLVDLYGKCGSVDQSQQVFDSLPDVTDLVTWNALIAGYSREGHAEDVFRLFGDLKEEGLKADSVTFVCVLTACSHSGLVAKGKVLFERMRKEEFGVKASIEHYICMIDMLGRANELESAMAMVREMPFAANAMAWKAVLGGCRKWKSVSLGRVAFESLLEMGEGDAATFTLMANIYGSLGMWEEQLMVEIMRTNSGVQK